MTEFFDSSVFIAASWAGHPLHESCFSLISKASRKHSACAAHSLAEVYATMTSLPGRHRATPAQSRLLIEEIESRCEVVTLDGPEYRAAIETAAARGLVSGQIYDWLLFRCAEKVEARTIYTLNLRHFEAFGHGRIRTP